MYSEQGLRWIKNTNGLKHEKKIDKFIDDIIPKPKKQINEFVTFVKDNYFVLERVDVD